MKRSAGGDDGPTVLAGIVDVSRETVERLTVLADLVAKWQKAENLVGKGTLGSIWRRHIADSAQLVHLFPDARTWLDLGSGAGFPGLVIAIVTGAHVDLCEANQRKCAFLRQAIRATAARATVLEGRIEATLANWDRPVDVVTARGLAPLATLLQWTAGLITGGARAAFHKGRDFQREIDEAPQSREFDLVIHPSLVDSEGVILEVSRLTPQKDRGSR